MTMNKRPTSSSRRRNLLPHCASWSRPATAATANLEFGRFRVLLRRRQLLADGAPVELGTRAFDLLLILLEADGALVTKEELLSRAWSGVVVSEENLKFQVSALRKALGADRDVIHTEFGRGYRFIGVLRMNGTTAAPECLGRDELRSAPTLPSPAIPGSSPGRGGFWSGPYRCLRSFRSVNSAACTEL
jgi:DNA-binding winged helix-turn-helix (wHTH) protein